MKVEVLKTATWANVHITGQITKIQCGGAIAYVRENVRYNSFAISANARLGIKAGRLPADARQVLELRAPHAQWEAIAEVVRNLDNMGRDVERARWTVEWAESNLERS